ncbi:MAG: choice-of-anchor L domain-containing protein [Candidatus Eisenbacteria bacterium]|nr:choice-of-anchor L domain-containing protein [Candidatus Eisenbacteria bacterium]
MTAEAPINTELDGLTQVFFATGTILPGTNHIKIALADAGDRVLDSDVMIRCQSFTCGGAPITGACCLTSGQCVTLTNGDCFANGGTYLGDFSSCSPNPCGTGFGACCFPDLSCEVEDPDLCGQNGGSTWETERSASRIPVVPRSGLAATSAGSAWLKMRLPAAATSRGMGPPAIPVPAAKRPVPVARTAASARSRLPPTAATPSSAWALSAIPIRAWISPAPAATTVVSARSRSGRLRRLLSGNRTVCDPNPCQTPAGSNLKGPTSSPFASRPPVRHPPRAGWN